MADKDKDLTYLFVRDLDDIPLPPRDRWRPAPRKESQLMKTSRYVLYAGAIAAVLVIALIASFQLRDSNQVAASPSPTASTTTSPAPTASATPAVTTQPPGSTAASTGAITGRLGAPSEGIPPLTVYAISTVDQRIWFSVDVARFPPPLVTPRPTGTFAPGTEPRYTITGVAPGTYYVLAYRNDGQQPDGPGLYSRRVACRTGGAPSTCVPAEDPSLAVVTVNAGQTTTGIDVEDWVGPAGPSSPSPSYPPRPTSR